MSCQVGFSIFAKVLAILSFLLVVTFNYFAANPSIGLFQTTTGDVSNQYPTPLTPAGFTFSIWGLIYVWQAGIIAYAIASFFLKDINYEGHLYENLTFHSAWFYIVYAITGGLNCAWIILFDRAATDKQLLIACCVILYAFSALLYVCLFLSYREVHVNIAELLKYGRADLLWSHRIIQQNGLSVYAGWTTAAMHLNLAFCLIHITNVAPLTAGYIALGFLLAFILVYFFLDLFLWDEYTRYVITPHLVFLWAAGGIYSKQSAGKPLDAADRVFLIEVLLAVSAMAVLVKLVVLIVRAVRDRNQIHGQLA